MYSVMKVKDNQIIMYNDGSITITQPSGYTHDVPKDSNLHAIFIDMFKMRELLLAIAYGNHMDETIYEAIHQARLYINSLPK